MFGLLMHLFIYYSQINNEVLNKINDIPLVYAQDKENIVNIINLEEEKIKEIKNNIDIVTQNQFLPLAKIIDNNKVPQKVNPYNLGVELTASNVLLLDYSTMMPLYKKNAEQKVPIASITKLVSALVIIDSEVDLEKAYQYEEDDPTLLGYRYVYKGDKVKLIDLLRAALVGSDNTALTLLVKASGFSEKEFVGKMNEKITKIGLEDTTFTEITGLDHKNVSTAYDVAKLLKYLSKNHIEEFLITSKREYKFKPLNSNNLRRVHNTNKLLTSIINKSPLSIELGKTGHIDEAGYCLATIVNNKDIKRKVIAVVLNSETNDDRFEDLKSLVMWGFDNYEWK